MLFLSQLVGQLSIITCFLRGYFLCLTCGSVVPSGLYLGIEILLGLLTVKIRLGFRESCQGYIVLVLVTREDRNIERESYGLPKVILQLCHIFLGIPIRIPCIDTSTKGE